MSHQLGAGGFFLPDENPEADAKVALPLEAPSQNATEAFERRARLAEDRLAEVLAAYRKLKNENEGYRDRITRNLERRFDQRRERLLVRFIEILDNLDRALEAAELSYAGNPLIDGLILVRTQLLQTLQEEGLERIPVVGLPYDPAVSEAVETRPVTDPDQHHVVLRDLQRGYRLNGRVARASRVAVGEYSGEGAAAKTPLGSSARNPFPLADAPTEAGGLVSPAEEADAFLDALEPVPDKKDDETP